jgi:hypothetical protein
MRSHWLADAAAAILAPAAEAAWITVFAAALSAPLGPPGPYGSYVPLLFAVILGVVAGRVVPHGRWRPLVLLALAALAVGTAVAIGPAIGLVVATGQRPVAAYPLLALALLRGVAAGAPPGHGDAPIAGLVRVSPVLLGAGWLLGLAIAGDGRGAFVAEATFGTLTFIVAGSLALGTSRLAALGREARLRPRGEGASLLLVLLVLACVLAVVVPAAAILGGPVETVVGGAVAALFLGLATVAGSVIGAAFVIADALVGLVRGLLGISPSPSAVPPAGTPEQPSLPPPGEPSGDVLDPLLGTLLLLALLAFGAWLAVRWGGRRRREASDAGVAERRAIVLERRPVRPSLHLAERLGRRRSTPGSALEAYPRLLEDWASLPAVARDPSETPSAHAARLRAAGVGDRGLDLLAADYQLARFGGVILTAREERRAVARWRRLRERRPGSDAPARAPLDEADRQAR